MIILKPPTSITGISVEPKSDWTFSDAIAELQVIESSLIKPSFQEIRVAGKKTKTENAFVMRVTQIDFDESDSDMSDSEESEDEAFQPVVHKLGVPEFAFSELTLEHQFSVQVEIRNHRTTVEAQIVARNEKFASGKAQIEKAIDYRRKIDKKLDMHHQRMTAEALDKHLTSAKRLHEHRSQLQERRIRIDAAEEAPRKEKALHEENLRQQKAKAEEEAKRYAAQRAEEKKAAEEAEKAKETAEKLANKTSAATAATLQIVLARDVQSAGNLIRAAENALKLEERILQIDEELKERNQSIMSGLNMDWDKKEVLRKKELELARRIRQISGTVENVGSKASEFLSIFNDQSLPQSFTLSMFAKKIVQNYETPNAKSNTSVFACGHLIVLISAQVPEVMNPMLAELYRVCIYAVPKHIIFSKNAFPTQESYYKAIGFRETEGNLETRDEYIERLSSYMKLYGALVQTEVQGINNMYGLEEGWTWLSWVLKALPPSEFTAVALEAILGMAGYALHRKYKGQFMKILNGISLDFVPKLKALGEVGFNSSVITRLQHYIESKVYLIEPEGCRLTDSLSSHNANFDAQNEDRRQFQQYQQYHETRNN